MGADAGGFFCHPRSIHYAAALAPDGVSNCCHGYSRGCGSQIRVDLPILVLAGNTAVDA